MTTFDYDDWLFPFGAYAGKLLSEIPDTYLDWVIGQDWFVEQSRNEKWLEAIERELKTRRKSRCYVPDMYGKTLEDL